MSAVADLEAGLEAMLHLKPPGVSTSRIKNLTELCQSNIKDESLLVTKFYTQFKKAPPTHKLGVLYLVDSVVRKWMEQAKHQQQEVSSAAPAGTYAAGVHRVAEIIPALMDDILQTAPADQKDRIKKLVDIWERAQTFSPTLIDKFRQQMSAPPQSTPQTESTTPPGSPPPGLPGSEKRPSNPPVQAPIQSAPSSNNIMEVLASIAKQSAATAPPPSSTTPPVASTSSTPTMPMNPYGAPVAPPTVPSYSQPQQPFNVNPTAAPPVSMPGFPAPYLAGLNTNQGFGIPALSNSPATSAFPPVVPPAVPAAPTNPAADINQVMLIKTLIDQGLRPEQITAIIQSMSAAAPSAAPAYPAAAGQPQNGAWGAPAQGGRQHDGGDHRGSRDRSRSKSPDRWGGRGSRGGGFDRHSGSGYRSSSRDRNRDRSDYRHRSPMGRRDRTPTSHEQKPIKKWVEYDRSLRPGHIKVLSRTLFVGGVTCSQAELHDIFSRVGQVQSVIINKEKRHAFVKMLTRQDAIEAKKGMSEYKSGHLALRTRWGVGFGPRDCCDYETGTSVIPISRLTEADRKWLVTAEYGGTGGAPIDTGICVEEPDIEIGAGVSSKAISRRVQTDKGGANGPKSSRTREEDYGGNQGHGHGGNRGDRPRHRDIRRDDDDGGYKNPLNPNLIPPNYAYGMGGMSSMPTYPGYSYTGQDSNTNTNGNGS